MDKEQISNYEHHVPASDPVAMFRLETTFSLVFILTFSSIYGYLHLAHETPM